MSGPVSIDIEVDVKPTIDNEVAQLARLSPLEYDQQREAAAKRLNVRVGTLDAEVAKLRSNDTEEQAEQIVEEISPGPSRSTARNCSAVFRRSTNDTVSCIRTITWSCRLWHWRRMYSMRFRYSQSLNPVARKRCGKTVLLEVSEAICIAA